jgi:hypothetical protein
MRTIVSRQTGQPWFALIQYKIKLLDKQVTTCTDLLQANHRLAHHDTLTCKHCFRRISVIRKLNTDTERYGTHLGKQASESLTVERHRVLRHLSRLSMACDIFESGIRIAFKYHLDHYTM